MDHNNLAKTGNVSLFLTFKCPFNIYVFLLQVSNKESEESLTFSMTPPVLQENKQSKDENTDESISEHLTVHSGGTENDRSFQEIEISYQPSLLLNIPTSEEDVANISQERSVVLKSTFEDDSEDDFKDVSNKSNSGEGPDRVRSILEEILCNDQFQSDPNLSINIEREDSFNLFKNVNLDETSISHFKHDLSLNEKNLYASNFQLPLLNDRQEIEKRVRDFEELLAVKDTTIAALTSELDSIREGSHTNTGSTLSTTEYKQLQEEFHHKVRLCVHVN